MGLLIDGQWQDLWYDTKSSGGRFIRSESQFRHWVTVDGQPGPTGEAGFKAEKDRYHLYVSYACPWAHRTLIYRALKGLEEIISVSFVHWLMDKDGWTFDSEKDNIVGDNLYDLTFAHQLYTKANSQYSGRVTVPILWDKKKETIVSNESSDIIRMFNTTFDTIGAKSGNYYPEALQDDIDTLNEEIYHNINNGVYKCGFATSQSAYDEAIVPLFDTLERLDARLSNQRFLLGDTPTEVDWRLFPTLYRFDAIYVCHFKCCKKRLTDFSNLWPYTRDLYQWNGISKTTNLEHAIKHYYLSHTTINPSKIIPSITNIDWEAPHNRAAWNNTV